MTAKKEQFEPTPSQTVGPFFHIGLTNGQPCGCLAALDARGERIRLTIRVLDGDGAAVPDAMIELWQADASGKYDHPDDAQDKVGDPAFRGFGRLPTDANGIATFETVRPGRVPGPNGSLQAPHINVHIVSRGMLRYVSTRVYFADDLANAEDAILLLVGPSRRQTLLACADAHEPSKWRIDFRLCGDSETVFFDV